jgi:trans-aconitate methyltransferase
MTAQSLPDPSGHHDWESADYVEQWITSDVLRDDERRPVLRSILDRLVVDRREVSRVLDVGGGYGVLTRELLESFPGSSAVLVDLSEPMLAQARIRLADCRRRLTLVQADLRDARWASAVEGPFQIVASAMAVHNVRDPVVIRQIYAAMASLITPGGWFVNIDLVRPARVGVAAGGKEVFDLLSQLQYLQDLGLGSVDCVYREASVAALVAVK